MKPSGEDSGEDDSAWKMQETLQKKKVAIAKE
jgi:hypothetical protein